MERKFLFNYERLNNYLIEWQKDPNWTDWELTVFRDNCRNNIANVLNNPEECIITINESTWEIKINGESDLQDKFYMIPTWFKMSNKAKLYRQIKLAMEEARNRWIYNQVFKEIKD